MGAPADAESMPGISIAGMGDNGEPGVLLFLSIDSECYASGPSIPVDNTHVFGGLMALDDKGKVTKMIGMLRGSLQLDKAARDSDGLVEGRLSVDLFSKLPKL